MFEIKNNKNYEYNSFNFVYIISGGNINNEYFKNLYIL